MDPTQFYNLYRNSAYYVDSLIGELIFKLKKTNQLENSIVIITGDHGQEFNDNGKNYWGHNGNYSRAQLHVPLLIYDYNLVPRKYNNWTFHYDVLPSIMKDHFQVKNNFKDYSYGCYLYDNMTRNRVVVGSSDDFAIISPHEITKIYYSGLYDLTDERLNTLDKKIDFSKLRHTLDSAQQFYHKY